MSQPSQYKIFISYRRGDTQYSVGHIYDRLKTRFGADAIFMDVNDIPPGYVFATYIHHVLQQCRVALVIIGPSWPTIAETRDNPYKGQPRLNNPADNVRIETEQALSLAAANEAGAPIGDLRLIPLLVQGAHMPAAEQLPESLWPLTRFNSATVRHYPTFDEDIEQLIGVIASWIGGAAPAMPPVVQPPQPAASANDLVSRLLPQIRDAFRAQDWPQVARLAAYLQRNAQAEEIPTEVYAMQGRALMAEHDYAGAKVAWDTARVRDPLDVAALRAAAEARIALDTPAERAAALPLLDDALTLSGDRDQRLTLLRISAHVLSGLANAETGPAAQARWTALLRVANEGLTLAGEGDSNWQTTRLEALDGLGRDSEALDAARALTARQGSTAALWLARARLAWNLAGESPTDEVRESLDAARRLAPVDQAVAQARLDLLVILKPDRFPPRLAELGFTANKRNGVAFIVPPVCSVPAGEFLMGSDKRRYPQAYNSELPQHRVNLAAYSIARFPVTVAEYACFVETGQRQPNHWKQQMQTLDRPVVYVSWDNVVAYADWMAQQTGQPWRLPTEAEWEKAARWDARSGIAHLYPWGDAFDQSRANTSESGRGGTTAVGSYPNGASPYGAEEMAGNVWEWTHSLYKAYPYNGNDGREVENSPENRVLRGGSWNGVQQAARAAFRTDFGPDYLNNNIGFRLVLIAAGS